MKLSQDQVSQLCKFLDKDEIEELRATLNNVNLEQLDTVSKLNNTFVEQLAKLKATANRMNKHYSMPNLVLEEKFKCDYLSDNQSVLALIASLEEVSLKHHSILNDNEPKVGYIDGGIINISNNNQGESLDIAKFVIAELTNSGQGGIEKDSNKNFYLIKILSNFWVSIERKTSTGLSSKFIEFLTICLDPIDSNISTIRQQYYNFQNKYKSG